MLTKADNFMYFDTEVRPQDILSSPSLAIAIKFIIAR